MSIFVPLGPKRPIKKPKPYSIDCVGGVIFLDDKAEFSEGSEVFVCTEETVPQFELLRSGVYQTSEGAEFGVTDGVLDYVE